MPLPQGTRICHLRTNMGTDWADNVVPVLPELGAKPTDIVVRSSAFTISVLWRHFASVPQHAAGVYGTLHAGLTF